jgi:hypothetical protein
VAGPGYRVPCIVLVLQSPKKLVIKRGAPLSRGSDNIPLKNIGVAFLRLSSHHASVCLRQDQDARPSVNESSVDENCIEMEELKQNMEWKSIRWQNGATYEPCLGVFPCR